MAQDILITPGSGEPQILFRGSGTNDTPIELNVLSSYQSASSSGSALLFEGTEGQLFAITDNLSSGVIFSVAGAAGLPFIEADASGDVRLIEYGRYVGVGTGTPAYQLDVFGTGRFSNGIMFGDGTTQTTAAGGGGGGSTTGTASGVAFFGDDNNLTESTSLTFDSGNETLNVLGNLDVTGAFTATTKSFLIDHPTKEGMKLQYGSLEGPENGVYVRGTTDLSTIELPDYWVGLVDENSITVSLTPVGSFQQLYVEDKNSKQITVGGVWGSYDYVVYAERKDVDKLEVEW